jgi:hypothetical protein
MVGGVQLAHNEEADQAVAGSMKHVGSDEIGYTKDTRRKARSDGSGGGGGGAIASR